MMSKKLTNQSTIKNEYKMLQQREKSLENEISRIKKNCNNLEAKLKLSQNDLRNKTFKHEKECESIIKVFISFLKKNKIQLDLTILPEKEELTMHKQHNPFTKNKSKNYNQESIQHDSGSKKSNSDTSASKRGLQGSYSHANLTSNDGAYSVSTNKLETTNVSSFDRFKTNRISNLNLKLKTLIEEGKIQIPNSNLRAISRKVPKII